MTIVMFLLFFVLKCITNETVEDGSDAEELDVDPRVREFYKINAEELQKRQIKEFADALGYGYVDEEDIKDAQFATEGRIEHVPESDSISRENGRSREVNLKPRVNPANGTVRLTKEDGTDEKHLTDEIHNHGELR
ncbi:uncharacterized protein LOC128234037 [Mya arenaria]|uniref:uncharacterized protein LOC128234037 n=1 Tax=Mya arenaria TaxID=6604 RepID=UPI0022E0C5C1|nr:uncharacterized protein LOC128234037 [Mya arenaria]